MTMLLGDGDGNGAQGRRLCQWQHVAVVYITVDRLKNKQTMAEILTSGGQDSDSKPQLPSD